jgi:hypothetical protein
LEEAMMGDIKSKHESKGNRKAGKQEERATTKKKNSSRIMSQRMIQQELKYKTCIS